MTINKKYLWYAGAGLAVFVFGFLLMRSCKITDRLSMTLGELKVIKADNAILARDAAQVRADAEKIKKDADLKEAKYKEAIKQKDNNIVKLSQSLKDLEASYPTLPDDTAKIQNLTAQVAAWTEKFNLSDAKCRDYEGIVFALTNKYKLQVTISDTWRSQFEGELKAGALKDDAIKVLKWDLKKARLFGTVKSVGVLALGGYVLYNLIKK